MKYSFERETFGVPINKHQAIQFKLADMATKLEASKLLVRIYPGVVAQVLDGVEGMIRLPGG